MGRRSFQNRQKRNREKSEKQIMMKNLFKEVELPKTQKSRNGIVFPTILSPNTSTENSSTSQLSVLIEAIEAQKPWLESVLHESGAILFRGFPVSTASDFNLVVEAFGYPERLYTGGAARRNHVVGRVFTANESPPDQRVQFHHEMVYSLDYPSKLFFFCEEAPGSGGETAIVQSYLIYDRMKEKYPEFVAMLEVQGVIYGRPMLNEDDLSAVGGRSWRSTFSTDEKSVAEQRADKIGMKLDWLEDNSAIAKTCALPAFGVDNSGRKTWFNSVASCDSPVDKNVVMMATFGNGKPMPRDVVADCLKIMEEESVAIPWQKGDFLLIDNLAVQHSRLPLNQPPRRILASLCN